MRLVAIPFLAGILALSLSGCVSEGNDADADAGEESASAGEMLPALRPAPEEADVVDLSAHDGGSFFDSPSTVVTSVRDVYAVVAPEVVDGYVLIGQEILAAYGHIRFTVSQSGKDYEFFGYVVEDSLYVRAAVCPCCGEVGLSHGGTCLSCRSCGTTFGLLESWGVDEVCGFPSGEVPSETGENCVAMLLNDLVEAYERTAAGEVELFEPEPEPVENEADDTSWPRCCRRPS